MPEIIPIDKIKRLDLFFVNFKRKKINNKNKNKYIVTDEIWLEENTIIGKKQNIIEPKIDISLLKKNVTILKKIKVVNEEMIIWEIITLITSFSSIPNIRACK